MIDEESGKAVSVSDLRFRTAALARAISGCWGIVSLYVPNHVDYAVIIWAIHRLGGTVAPMSPGLTVEELVYQLEIATPSLIVAHTDNLPIALQATTAIGLSHSRIAVLDGDHSKNTQFKSIDELIQRHADFPPFTEFLFSSGQAKEKIAFLCFSSGTTGKPKAVAISHWNVICNVLQNATFNRINEPYLWTGRKPAFHDLCCDDNRYFEEIQLRGSSTEYCTLPDHTSHDCSPQAVLFCKHPSTKQYDLSSVRCCMVAAAPVSAELTTQLLQVFPGVQLGQGYGMTETCATVSMFPVSQKVATLGSGGQLVSGTIARVVKLDGTLAGVGERARETFIDGWVRTGDEVVFHADGDLFVVDRIKEIIKVKGYQVAPSELEGHLLGHPDVADAGVIGVPDEYAGEVPFAFIVLKPTVASAMAKDASLARSIRSSIFNHVSSTKSSYKWLNGGIEFIDVIPKNASGKILRRVLRELKKPQPSGRARL
ncbi:4-coumarate--CoA ligase-like 7 [Grifola frondosa]|uniref:4-coumarate--CoA ligase-like 7 n=1 Tax=Grifola frondosa TaxID=5627 RepID=A0A1C7LZD9_GRIFR|nr:4-coumarate--CoA ligase-like 7 [Grifola frondosa]